MKEHCKLSDMNDFLYDVCLYVVNGPHLHYCAQSTVVPQYDSSSAAPSVRFVEYKIFDSDLEIMCERSPDTQNDSPNWGTSFSKDEIEFNQFKTMEGAFLGSEFLRNPGSFPTYGRKSASSSRGYLL
jgi:hypothetical protein